MTDTIAVAGASGNLGTRIVNALRGQGANVISLSRTSDLTTELHGVACVVSAMQGLRDTIVDAQTRLLDAALAAGVARFIPSDYSTDYTVLPVGENRNFDLRREFHTRLDAAPIASTAIFVGAFAEVLTYNIPLLDFAHKRVGYWGAPDWRMDFTTMDDTAAFTAAAALDPSAPRALHCASFQVTPNDLVGVTQAAFGTPFELVRLGSIDDLRAANARDRAAHPEGEAELMPSWQRGQYLQSMFSTQHTALDNPRYPGLVWTGLAAVLAARKQGSR